MALVCSMALLPMHTGSFPIPTVCLQQAKELWHAPGMAWSCVAMCSPAYCSLLAFRALLQIRAVRKKPGALSPVSFSPVLAQSVDHDEHSVSTSQPCVQSLGAGLSLSRQLVFVRVAWSDGWHPWGLRRYAQTLEQGFPEQCSLSCQPC